MLFAIGTIDGEELRSDYGATVLQGDEVRDADEDKSSTDHAFEAVEMVDGS